jgi:hypothetical protein
MWVLNIEVLRGYIRMLSNKCTRAPALHVTMITKNPPSTSYIYLAEWRLSNQESSKISRDNVVHLAGRM